MTTDTKPEKPPYGYKPYSYPFPDGGTDIRGFTWPIPPTSKLYKPPTGPHDFNLRVTRDERKLGGNITAYDMWGYRMVVDDSDVDLPSFRSKIAKRTNVTPWFNFPLFNLPLGFPKYVIVAPEPGSYPPKWMPV